MRTAAARRRGDVRQAGMSLAEVLFATAIFAIIILGALLVYDRSNKVFKQGVENADTQQATRVAFEKLLSDVRMAGFDFDRDGSPSNGEQQPDEQIEYAGVAAITFRGNLDYFTDVANNHGLEPDYVVPNVFPTVTTANSEIVTYALKSTSNPAANSQQIRFWADVQRPRSVYSGGDAETEVVIGTAGDGYDLCDDANGCSDPPYTLYRITLDERGNPTTPVPIAENIRSLYFSYFTEQAPVEVDVPATADDERNYAVPTDTASATARQLSHGAIGGKGQYDPDDVGGTDDYEDRNERAAIRAIRVALTGMSQEPEMNYENPNETLASVKQHHTYELQTLVIPRNLGYSGTEDPHLGPPGGHQITSVCAGDCAVTHAKWSPTDDGSPVEKYFVCYDTDPLGSFTNCVDAELNLESDVPGLVPGGTYSFRVKAINSEGQTLSGNPLTVTVRNRTQPTSPTQLIGTSVADGIQLEWDRPASNTNAHDDLFCVGIGGSTDASRISSAETLYYWLYRSLNPNFTPGGADSELVVSSNFSDQGSRVVFVDNAANAVSGKGPANCMPYYYRIQTRDYCTTDPTWNEGNDVTLAQSPTWYPVVADQAAGPFEFTPVSPTTPAKPAAAAIDVAASSCNNGTNLCTVKLDWTPVQNDDQPTPAPLSIDTYRIKRWRELGAVRTVAPIDSTQPDGYVVTGALVNGPTFTDSPANSETPPEEDNGSGTPYVYIYTVQAQNCSVWGAESDEVRYPACTFNDTVMDASDELTGDGTAGSPWVLAGGDVIIVSNPNRTISRVVFNVTDSSGVSLPGYPFTDTAAPFQIPWNNMDDGETYMLSTFITDSNGCVQSPGMVRYITDQAPAGCYPFVESSTWNAETHVSGQVYTRSLTLNVKNNSPLENMTLKAVTFRFANSGACPSNGNMEIDSITFGATTDGTDRPLGTSGAAVTITGLNIPAAEPGTIVRNTGTNPSYGIVFKFNYRGDRCNDVSAFTAPLTTMCLHYQLASEPGVTKICNIIGTGTNNPVSCN